MENIFKDPLLHQRFVKNGYVTIPFASPEEVADLKAFYYDLNGESKPGFHPTMFHENVAYREKVDRKLSGFVNSKIGGILNNYTALYSNYMVKEPRSDSEMYVHQDWAYVDEAKHFSLQIWFPLLDLNYNNGAICVVPGSQNILNYVRGYGTQCPILHLSDIIKRDYLIQKSLKAGEAIIWHQRMIHYSPANKSDDRRISPVTILIPEGADVFHWFVNPNDPKRKIEMFEANNEYFMNYKLGERPGHGKSLGIVDDDFGLYREKDLHFLRDIDSGEDTFLRNYMANAEQEK
ncbi:MAG: phytanoyl-CoA dioxygenase family protein [Bacteroidetes bacterium]|nr:phytanoyl-CoA dioxygenase family protein [Bacteroidota bacterium]